MRIGFVTPEYVTERDFDGGLASYLDRCTKALRAAGHEPIVLVTSETEGRIVADGIQVIRVKRLPQPARGPASVARARDWLRQARALRAAARRVDRSAPFDVLQYTSYTAPGSFRLGHVPSVVRISSFHADWARHYGARMGLGTRIEAGLEMLSLHRADALFAPSRLLADRVSRSMRRNVEVIETPFDPAAAESDDSVFREILKDRTYLLFFGTLGVLKGVVDIAEILQRLLARHPALHFVFVGKDLGHEGESMMDLSWKRAGAYRDRVLYLGRLPRAQLFPIVDGAMAVVLPSRIDNLPNTCIEAMSQGKIVIGTAGTSFEQLIDHGVSGFLARPADPPSLLGEIERVLALSEAERNRITRAARRTTERLAPEKIAKQLEALYHATMRRRAATGPPRPSALA